jgi:hypothetical protein
MTREQIEQQLRLDNPTTTDDAGNRHGPGSEVYNAAIHRWADAMENAVKPPLAEAENYQVRAWMIRGGLDPDLVPTIIAQVVPDGPERKEALMRWDYAVRVPRDFPLVDKIGEKMGLTPEQIDAAWPAILEL